MSLKKKVKCIETGKVYDSISEAADRFGVNETNISYAANGKTKTSCGYHWKFVKDEDHRTRPSKTIKEVQEEARRRTEETGKLVTYADIQKEETLRMIRERDEMRRANNG